MAVLVKFQGPIGVWTCGRILKFLAPPDWKWTNVDLSFKDRIGSFQDLQSESRTRIQGSLRTGPVRQVSPLLF